MASGVPIITTPAGIAKEWIKNKKNGIIIPYQDAAAIFKALLWIYNHPEEAERYGKNAKTMFNKIDFNNPFRSRMDIYKKLAV